MKRAVPLAMAGLAAVLVTFAGVALANISPGTKLTGNINRSLDSKDAQVGQTFLLTDVHTSNFDINGATLYGHVANVQHAGQGTPGKIELAVDKVNTRAGSIYKTTGEVTNVQVDTRSNAGKEAAAAAGGALVAGLLGKSGWWAALGGAGGYLVAKNSRQNVSIPQGSLVTVTVSQATRVQ
jgi:hypothetical protein